MSNQISAPTPPNPPVIEAKTVVSAVNKLVGSTSLAAATGGEMTFTQTLSGMDGLLPGVELGPLQYLLAGVSRIFKGFTGVFKDKKKGIPVLVVSFLWLVLLLLPALGVNATALRGLSFLTFAQGGTSGGGLGLVGGLIGKGFIAYFISGLLLPLFTGGKPFTGLGGGFKSLFGAFAVKEKSAWVTLLVGSGLALISYNILTGTASMQNSMVGIVAFLLSLRALAHKAGFLRGFIMSVLSKFSKAQMPDISSITRIMAGWASGFALAVLLSATGIGMIGYITGAVFIIAALVLVVIANNVNKSKEVPAA